MPHITALNLLSWLSAAVLDLTIQGHDKEEEEQELEEGEEDYDCKPSDLYGEFNCRPC